MNFQLLKKRYKELIILIQKYDNQYYLFDKSSISDFEYDLLMKELESIEKKFPKLKNDNSPSSRVSGGLNKNFKTVQHLYPMLSLTNSYSKTDLIDFLKRVKKNLPEDTNLNFTTELKFDGLAISLIYDNGELNRAVTRGNGLEGDVVTTNVRTIRSLPLHVSELSQFEVRAEIFFTHSAFEKANRKRNESNEDLFANPRNAASGTLKMQNSKEVAKRKLSIFCYYLKSESISFKTHSDSLSWLRKENFPVCEHYSKVKMITEVVDFCNHWEKDRKKLKYDIDGVVIKVDELKLHKILSETTKSPRWAIAYKFKAEQVETQVVNIVWQIGRTGVVTPVAEFVPIHLAGTIVKRATLHNIEEFNRKEIRLNDTVLIEKGGDIIPKILSVVIRKRKKESIPYIVPKYCPCCESLLIKLEKDAHIRCINSSCAAQIQRKIEHFVSKEAMDISGMGSAVIQLLRNDGLIQSVDDIYKLKQEQVEKLERMAKKSAKNLIESIQNSKKCSLDRVIYALGIRFVGRNVAKRIAKEFRTIENLINAPVKILSKVEGVGQRVAESIVDFFENESNINLLLKLKGYGIEFQINYNDIKKGRLIFSEKKFALTGTLENFKRNEAKRIIENNGGKIVSAISNKTSILLRGEKAGSKLEKAIKLGIEIWNEETFLEKLRLKINRE